MTSAELREAQRGQLEALRSQLQAAEAQARFMRQQYEEARRSHGLDPAPDTP